MRIKEDCSAGCFIGISRLYLVGTYNAIDWDTEYPSGLGEDFVSYRFREGSAGQPAVSVAIGPDGDYILRLIETKRYILKIESDDEKETGLPGFQNEGNKFLKLDKDSDSVTFQFVNYLGRSRIYFSGSKKFCYLKSWLR